VLTDEFDYDLPSGSIAQQPADPRDSCRLMVIDRQSGQIDDRGFHDLEDYVSKGDVLVVNETRVLPARLHGVKEETGGAAEVLLLRERYSGTWECLVRPGRRLKPGARIVFGEGLLTGQIVDVLEESGGRLVRFKTTSGDLMSAVHELGEVPLPPYIVRPLSDPEQYQTIFASEERSVAAPTAGLHFTQEYLDRLREKGVRLARVGLDVGLDTFRPVAEDDPHDHPIHTEHFRVGDRAVSTIEEARASGGRVFAVGTTTVRALESAWDDGTGKLVAQEGTTDLFILPGYEFHVVDALLTNFHMPRSTLLMLVSAFAGRDLVIRAYDTARERHYGFLSFGDATLFL